MGNKDSELQLLVLSALWHDVGKIRQKAGFPLENEYEKLKTYCCPAFQGNPTHIHVLHSGQFVWEHFKTLGDAGKIIENLTLYHHRPENFPSPEGKKLCKILTISDWLSSGERSESGEEEISSFRAPLISIFSRISLPNQEGDSLQENKQKPQRPEREEYFPLKPLGSGEIFPTPDQKEALNSNSYPELFRALNEDAQKLKKENLDDLITQSYFLLMKFGFFVPSASWKIKPDVTLFGHSQTTAAIASCIFKEGISEEDIDRVKEAILQGKGDGDSILHEPRFLLIGGDLSGIQDFIYSITSEGALKSLRGRSFYLQILTEALAKSLLRELDLPITNLLTCAGGHFYILAPKTGTLEKLEKVKRDFNSVLIKAHRGKLSAVIATCSISWKDFIKTTSSSQKEEKGTEASGFVEAWGKVGLQLGMEKRRKYRELLSSEKRLIFGPFDEGGIKKVCQLCGEEIEEGDKCSLCQSFEDLSRDLSKNFLVEKQVSPNIEERPKIWQEVLNALGLEYQFSDSPQENSYLINDTDFVSKHCLGFKFLGKHVPINWGQIITLDEMAEKSTGLKRWGVLRGDVDNLGRIFRDGLGQEKTISRLNTLSSLLSYFFSFYVEKLIKDNFPDSCYLVYSGGDDLLVLGTWDKLPELALNIREKFTEFTSSNCTISCGLSIPPSAKFPLYQAAEEAGEMEDRSKFQGRDRITFLEETMTWDQFKEIKKITEEILSLIKSPGEDKPVRSLLRILQTGYEEKYQVEKGRIPVERIWRFVYSLKRFGERYLPKGDQERKLMDLRDKFICDYSIKPYLNVSVRWAEFLTRKEM